MAKVLVTGAAGHLGSEVVRELLAGNDNVRGLILPGDPARDRLNGLAVEICEGNLANPDDAARAVDGVDAIIHTANLVMPLPGMSESDFFTNNVLSTFNLVRAASKRADALERLVHVSSSSVYPNDPEVRASAYNPVDEQHPQRPEGIYGLSKKAGEEILNAHTRETGLRTTVIRPSMMDSGEAILGHFMAYQVIGLLQLGQRNPASALHDASGAELWHGLENAVSSQGQPCAMEDQDGRPWMFQPTDPRDVARGCVQALKSPAALGEAINLSGARPVTFAEGAQQLADRLGRTVMRWQVPVRYVYALDTTKARSLIGYSPSWGLSEMLDSAMLARQQSRAH